MTANFTELNWVKVKADGSLEVPSDSRYLCFALYGNQQTPATIEWE